MPNTFRANGFYECQWGYMLDSQPAYAIDVAEQFDMTGDIDWLRKFKPACEKVIDFMIKRDSDGNGLFEVIQRTHKEQKGTDWMDVVWASCFFPYEDNAGLKNVNYPYPNYENGDLFLAWAELGTRCYAEKNPTKIYC